MQEAKPWHEDDVFWETWGPVMFGSQLVANATVEIDNVISLLKIPSGARVLDLCCGIGRHSLELARRGFLVTGVDRTRSYLDEAKKQADMELLGIELIEEDMRLFSRMNTFDAVINMFTAFGYFEDAEDDRRVVANIYKSLKAGGTCIIDTHGKETLARIFQERGWSEKDGVMVLEERKVSPIWSWMWNRWIMLKGNERVEG